MLKNQIKNNIKIQLTERDVTILKFIHAFGFCTMPQLEQRFALKSRRAYQIMQKLTQAGLLHHQRIFYAQHGIYYLTDRGARCTDLPAIEKIPIGIYTHQLQVIDVYLKLRKRYPDTEWISERYLKHEKFYTGIGKPGHVADGMLHFKDGTQVAIEVELSLKSKNRLEQILKSYGAQLHIHEVWYYCAVPIIPTLSAMAASMPFIKIYPLDEFLS